MSSLIKPSPVYKIDNIDTSSHGVRVEKLPVTGAEAQNPILAYESTHTVCQDSGWEAGFHLATAVDNAFILGYAFLVYGFLGWAAGTVLFVVGGAAMLYCNLRLATLCMINGRRYTRFRDISGDVLGGWGWWLTVVGQWINIIGGNIGLTILGGQALKGIYDMFDDNINMKLADWMIVTGVCNALFSLLVPHLHNLRLWSAIACICTIIFVVIVIGVSAHDGRNFTKWVNENDPDYAAYGRSYSVIADDDKATVIFDAMGALATIAFAFTTVITPEIQATVRDPPVKEFHKTLFCTYAIGAPIFLVMSIVGFWAYGNDVEPNLLSNLSGPKWAKTIAYLGVFIQTVVSVQVYASPIYETVDTKFGDAKVWSGKNIILRLVYRSLYIAFTTFVAALLPFFGDFVALLGAITVFPIACCLVLIMYNKVNRTAKELMWWVDTFLAGLFAVLTVATATSALRFIVVDAHNYSVFANIEG